MLAGIVIAVGGVVAAAVGFSMDTTYPEEVPGWTMPIIVIGIVVALGGVIGKASVKSR